MPHLREVHFADQLIEAVRRLRHPLCVGLDPHLSHIPEPFRRGDMAAGRATTVAAVGQLLAAVLERIVGRVAVVKPQIAFFEALGPPGLELLRDVVARARARGLLVLLDAKRGDIGSTAEAYAAAYLDRGAPLEVDAITLSPYLGADTLAPFAARCSAHGRGMFVLVRTSNPGSGDFQDRDVEGAPLYARVAVALAPLERTLQGRRTRWSSLGVVVGAGHRDEAERVREVLPSALMLVPGYGAQGGTAKDAVRGFVTGPSGLEGGIVSSSRAILFPDGHCDGDAKTWERGFDAALAAAIEALGSAVSG
jgi:orotidine-5'-phosphate decarboxylase